MQCNFCNEHYPPADTTTIEGTNRRACTACYEGWKDWFAKDVESKVFRMFEDNRKGNISGHGPYHIKDLLFGSLPVYNLFAQDPDLEQVTLRFADSDYIIQKQDPLASLPQSRNVAEDVRPAPPAAADTGHVAADTRGSAGEQDPGLLGGQ